MVKNIDQNPRLPPSIIKLPKDLHFNVISFRELMIKIAGD